jgi:hypothetical protein
MAKFDKWIQTAFYTSGTLAFVLYILDAFHV